MLWTRTTADSDGPYDVAWTVARDEAFATSSAAGRRHRTPKTDGTVHVDVAGLEPGTTYYFQFGQRRATRRSDGRTRALPTPARPPAAGRWSRAQSSTPASTDATRTASRTAPTSTSCCTSATTSTRRPTHRGRAKRRGADIGRPFDPLHECVTLEDYRTRYPPVPAQPRRATAPRRAPGDRHARRPRVRRWGRGTTCEAERKPGVPTVERAPTPDAFRPREEWLPGSAASNQARPRGHTCGAEFPLGWVAQPVPHRHPHRATTSRLSRAGDTPMTRAERHSAPISAMAVLRAMTESKAPLADSSPNPSVMGEDLAPGTCPKPSGPRIRQGQADRRRHARVPTTTSGTGTRPRPTPFFRPHHANTTMDNVVVLSGDVHVSPSRSSCTQQPVRLNPITARGRVRPTPSLTSQNLDDKMGWPRRDRQGYRRVEGSGRVPSRTGSGVDLDSHGYVVVDVHS